MEFRPLSDVSVSLFLFPFLFFLVSVCSSAAFANRTRNWRRVLGGGERHVDAVQSDGGDDGGGCGGCGSIGSSGGRSGRRRGLSAAAARGPARRQQPVVGARLAGLDAQKFTARIVSLIWNHSNFIRQTQILTARILIE